MRQVLMPFGLGLLVFTFLLIYPPLLKYGEQFVAKGVPSMTVLRLMATLVPQAIALTIPMSLLLALLIGFGRLSADREFVAMQACGVSLWRLLRPVSLLSITACAATAYVMIVSLPSANQTFREITFRILSEAAEGEVKPRVFYDRFPNLQLYVRDMPPNRGGWNGVFMSDTRPGQPNAVYFARHGRVVINRQQRTVDMVLEDGSRHIADPSGKYEVFRFGELLLRIDPSSVFTQEGPSKGDREMTIAELRAKAAEVEARGESAHNQWIAIQQKFSIPVACLVFGLIGLALGATHRRDGMLGSFVLGVVIVFVYYVPLYLGPNMAKGGAIPPWFAAWLPNIILGALGVAALVWRDRVADQPIRFTVPAFLMRERRAGSATTPRADPANAGIVRILDRYVVAMYLRILALSAVAMLGIFYISTVIDRSGQVFKGVATWSMLGQYVWYMTPQFLYYVVPLSVLLAAVVTVSVLTKNSELIVMKACGISLYRIAVPMLACAMVGGIILFGLDQTILGPANYKAEYTLHLMRGGAPDGFDTVSRHWAIGKDGTIYHYNGYNPRRRQLIGLDMFEFGETMARPTARMTAERADYSDAAANWHLQRGWRRQFTSAGDVADFAAYDRATKPLEPASYFGTEQPYWEFMTYTQLLRYTEELRSAGFSVLEQQVALARKVSFPFVTLIMTLIAIPFAVTIGRSGAMAGIGIGLGLAITYWIAGSIFAALGAGGLIAPALAAWAPNMLFGAGAAYLLLTVRT
jgi:LPS export ABC transporter permease LptG/LPS export ABC transporter permease LptF